MSFRDQIISEAKKAIEERTFPGGVVGVVTADGNREVVPFGNFTYDSDSTQVKETTIYDTASLTKSIPTGSMALQLIDEGILKTTEKLVTYLPEFQNSDREEVYIQHLLTYTLDGYGLASALANTNESSISEKSCKDVMRVLLTRDFDKRPGTVFKYTNIPAALLGLVIERATEKTIDELAKERFLEPLKMKRSTFHPENFSKEEIVPTEEDSWRGLVHGIVHDESAYVCKKENKIVGHAGLFSTAPDLLNFLEMLLNKGTFQNHRYFSEDIIEQMHTNQIAHLDMYTGLGWELNQPRYMGEYCAPHTFGKTGFTGTLCVCDIEKGIAYTILTNRIFPKRPSDSSAINRFRKNIGEIILK